MVSPNADAPVSRRSHQTQRLHNAWRTLANVITTASANQVKIALQMNRMYFVRQYRGFTVGPTIPPTQLSGLSVGTQLQV
jgi:hypothetical protein